MEGFETAENIVSVFLYKIELASFSNKWELYIGI